MSLKGLRGFKKSSVLSPKIRSMIESGLSPMRLGDTPAVPTLNLSYTSIDEGDATARVVGTLYVTGGTGTYTFTETADPDSKFTISGNDLVTSAALDYETKNTHNVTIQADNGLGSIIIREFIISVNNVLEGTLAPTTAAFGVNDGSGTVITTVTGFDVGAGEIIISISPNDGRLTFTNTQIVKGFSASTPGIINLAVTTSAGRILNIAINATEYTFKNFAALFTGGADGLMIDLTDKTTLFQDVNGALPVDTNGNYIGLALDQHKWGGLTLAAYRDAQAEKVTNSAFDVDIAGWTINNGGASGSATWDTGDIKLTASGSSVLYVYQAVPTVAGRWYEISVDYVSVSGGSGNNVLFYVGNAVNSVSMLNSGDVSATGAGTYRRFFKATGTEAYVHLQGRGGSGVFTKFSKASVKEIDGHHATQSGSARPTWVSATGDVAFNGSSQFLSTDYKAGSTVNAVAIWHRMGAVSAERYFMGSELSGNYFMFGFNASGYAKAYVGSPSSTINSTSLVSNSIGTLLFDKGATQTQVAVNGVVENTITHSGSMPTSAGVTLGCVNSSGTLGGYFPGGIKRVIVVQARAQDTMTAAAIHENLIAA